MSLNQYQAAVTPLVTRLLEHRRITVGGCWEWTRSVTEHGYGRMSWRNHVQRTHRLAAHLWLGMPLDSRDVVRHTCDNPPCFNPAHLSLGTQAENVKDMVERGRARGGDKPHSHCPEGHPLEGNNALPTATGRRCRECARRANRAYYARRKAREGAFWRKQPTTIRALETGAEQ